MGVAGVQVAIMAASAAMQAASAANQKKAASQQMRLKRAQQNLQMAEQERMREGELQKTLAKQNAWFGAKGVSRGSGSALNIAESAKSKMDEETRAAERSNVLMQQGMDMQQSANNSASNAAIASSLLSSSSSMIGKIPTK